MADILAGDSGHATFAPLSQAQTLSIAKHLQEQISELQARSDDFQLEYTRTKEDVHHVQQSVRNNDDVHNLQNGLATAQTLLDGARKDLARTNVNIQMLTQKVDENVRNTNHVREAQKSSDMRMSKMFGEIEHCIQMITDVRASIEKKMNSELTNLRDDFSKMSVVVKRLTEDQEVLKQSAQESSQAFRTAALARQNIVDQIANTNTMVQVLDQRSADISKCLKKTRQLVDDHANSVIKQEEDHVKLKTEVVEVISDMKASNAQIRALQEVIDKTNSGLKATQGQLVSCCTRWDYTRQELDMTKSNVKGLKEAHEIATARTQEMAGVLDMTNKVAQETKRGLLDTNSLVLPNLNFGAVNDLPQKPLTARVAGGMSSARPLNLKPLPKKLSPTSTKQGSPDKMNWI